MVMVLAALLTGCGGQQSHMPFNVLSKSALFDKDSVETFLSHTPASQEDSSRKLFLDGINEFKNKKNPASAIAYLLNSLSVYPSATSYYELGNALLENGKYMDALNAFEMAGKLDYKPLGNLLFKEACCYAELDDYDNIFDYVSYAVENGFVDRNKIFNDKHMKKFRNDPSFIRAYNEAMSGNGNPEEILWLGYSRDFSLAKFPFKLDSGTFRKMGEVRYISYDYEQFIPEMRDNKFSRDVGNEYFYVARFAGNPNYKMVVYGCQSYETDGAPVYYVMATFNNQGKLLDKRVIAGAASFDQLYREAVVTAKDRVEVKTYQLVYEKDVKENGFDNNPVISREQTGSLEYRIDADGKITELNL